MVMFPFFNTAFLREYSKNRGGNVVAFVAKKSMSWMNECMHVVDQ
jgi:hypothetical protein